MRLRGLLLPLLLSIILAGCSTTPHTANPSTPTPASGMMDDMTPTSPTPTTDGTAVVARETDVFYNATQAGAGPNATYAFEGPSTVNAGWVTFHLANHGTEAHQLVVIRLPAGESYDEHMGMMQQPAPGDMMMGGAHANATYVGGVARTDPMQDAQTTVHLAPGNYVIECDISGPAGIHALHGMTKALNVTASDNGVAEPTSDLTLTLRDFNFRWSANLTAGHHVVKVVNNGSLVHEAPIFHLLENGTIEDMLTWVGNPEGAPPESGSWGAGALSPTLVEYVDMDLVAGGTYGSACFLPDAEGNPHFTHGMKATWHVA